MKKIINGKRYDTDGAQKVYEWWNGLSRSDFSCCIETLYRKRTGEYFLYGAGGGNSSYAEHHADRSRSWGECVVPLTLEKAKDWVEKHCDAEDYEKEFGVIAEDDTRVFFGTNVRADLVATLRRRAAEQGITIVDLLESILSKAFAV